MIHRVMLCYGRLISLRLSMNTRMANDLNTFFIKVHVKSLNVVCESCQGETCLRHCFA